MPRISLTPGSPRKVIAAFGGNLRRLAGVTAAEAGNIWVAAQTSLSAKKDTSSN